MNKGANYNLCYSNNKIIIIFLLFYIILWKPSWASSPEEWGSGWRTVCGGAAHKPGGRLGPCPYPWQCFFSPALGLVSLEKGFLSTHSALAEKTSAEGLDDDMIKYCLISLLKITITKNSLSNLIKVSARVVIYLHRLGHTSILKLTQMQIVKYDWIQPIMIHYNVAKKSYLPPF